MFRECLLGEVLTLKRGYDLPSQNRNDGSIPIVSSSGITGTHSDAKVKGPGVVTGRYGTIGEVHFIDTDFWPLNTTLYVQDFKGNDPRFVAYFLRTLNFASRSAAAAVPGVNRNDLHRIPVRCPTPSLQRRIAATLSAYDDLIENNTRRIAILEEMARRIYEEWFVRFRFPGHEHTRMVDSDLGPVPEGWDVVRLDDVLVLQRGFDLPKQDRTDGPFPIISATGGSATHHECRVKGPGVVTGRSGSLGTVTYVESDFWPLNTTLWIKKFVVGSPLFSFYLLNTIDLAGFNSGAAVPTLNRNDLHGLPVLRPTPDVLAQFDEVAPPMMKLKRRLELMSENLRTTRDLLLPKLISGELDVSDLPEPQATAA